MATFTAPDGQQFSTQDDLEQYNQDMANNAAIRAGNPPRNNNSSSSFIQSTLPDRSTFIQNANNFDKYYGADVGGRVYDEEKNYDDSRTRIEGELSKYRTNLSRNAQGMIDSLEETFRQRKKESEAATKRDVAGAEAAGFRTGLTQYGSRLQGDIISAKERAGIETLSKLDAEEKSKILEAETARDEKDYEAFGKAMNELQQIRKDKSAAVSDIYKGSTDYDKFKRDKQRDIADTYARSVYDDIKGMDASQRDRYIDSLADKIGVDKYILRSAVLLAGDQFAKDNKKKDGEEDTGGPVVPTRFDTTQLSRREARKLENGGIDNKRIYEIETYLQNINPDTEDYWTIDDILGAYESSGVTLDPGAVEILKKYITTQE